MKFLKVRTITSTSSSCCPLSNPLPYLLHCWPHSRSFKVSSLTCLLVYLRLGGWIPSAALSERIVAGASFGWGVFPQVLGHVTCIWLTLGVALIGLSHDSWFRMGRDLDIPARMNLMTLAENLGPQTLFSIGYQQGSLCIVPRYLVLWEESTVEHGVNPRRHSQELGRFWDPSTTLRPG